MTPRIPTLPLLLTALVSLPATGAERLLTVEPASSAVTFLLEATGHDVEGRVDLGPAQIRFDPETGAISGELTAGARSAKTGNEKRDKTMHAKVLESDANPWFRFVPDRVIGMIAESGRSEFKLHGVLSIHGAEHEVTLPVVAEIEGTRVQATVKLDVPFVDWGMHDPSLFILRVAKVVNVSVSIAGTLSNAEERSAAELGASPAIAKGR